MLKFCDEKKCSAHGRWWRSEELLKIGQTRDFNVQ